MLVMQPAANKLFAGRSLALSNFVLMMRKNIVHPATVNIEGFAKILHAHSGAFNVPTRPALTQFSFPKNVAIFRYPSLPQSEVLRLFFGVFVLAHSCSHFELCSFDFG